MTKRLLRPVNIARCFTALVISGANTHDVKLLADTLDEMVVDHPDAKAGQQNLCLDAGYVGEPARLQIEERVYIPHVRPRGEELEEQQKNLGFKARRWVVEVCHAWFNRFRKLWVCDEKMDPAIWVSDVSRFGYRFMHNKTATSGQCYLWIDS
jgi:transposase